MSPLIGDFEQAFIDRLSPVLAVDGIAIPVDPYPDAPEQYQLTHPVGQVLVRYAGAQRAEGTGKRTLTMDIVIMATSLRQVGGQSGAHELIDATEITLEGWRPPGAAGPVAVQANEFVIEANGVWTWSVRVIFPVIRPHPEPDPGPLLRRIITHTTSGRTVRDVHKELP